MAQDALLITGLSKHFGGQRALDGVDFDVRAGEVHALLGENGAGKSTLIKVLAGIHQADRGQIDVDGRRAGRHHSPSAAAELGLRFVHQDLGLIDDLSVAENIALEVGYQHHHQLVSLRRTEVRARALTDSQGVAVDPRALVGDLPQAEKVIVAIARAFRDDARVIVLDEVSASLPALEVQRLQAAVRRMADRGVAFVWVTHRLDELDGFADRLTVLRDGRCVARAEVAATSMDQLVEWIVGRPVAVAERRNLAPAAGPVRLRVRGLLGPNIATPLSFEVGPGEVLGVTGLIGSGAVEVARLLGGSPAVLAGSAELDGAPLPLGKPRAMRLAGCNYVPGDRARDGALAGLSVRENLFPVRLRPGPNDRRWRMPGRERTAASLLADRFGVQPAGASESPLETLSGGNQQKVIFGRALRTNPPLLILADPTAGVDVGARQELHGLLDAVRQNGTAVVLASADFDEIAQQAGRALVMISGRVAAHLDGQDLTREALAAASYAGAQGEAA